MNYRVSHTTHYEYGEPVSISYHKAHLTPRTCAYQRCSASAFEVAPEPTVFGRRRVDFFGNESICFTIQEPHTDLRIHVESEVEIIPVLPSDPESTPAWESVRDRLRLERTPEALDACQYVFDSHYVKTAPELAAYAAPSFPAGRPILAAAMDLMWRIYHEFSYDPSATSIATPLDEVLANRRGVCQDFAHLQIGCMRSIGLPARYVSGYILASSNETEQHLVGAQASHAWLSVYVPGSGWIDVDPTNNMLPRSEHITLAWSRDYDEVSPVRGVILGGGRQELTVNVNVVRTA